MAKTVPPEFVSHLHEQLAPLGDIECRRFFGGWGFRSAGIQFAVVLRQSLYVVVDDTLRRDLIEVGSEAFSYDKKSGPVTVERFYSAPEDCLDDTEALLYWARRAIEAGQVGQKR